MFCEKSNENRRVEDGRGSIKPRFPSPLIKPDVRSYRIRLSDWIHLKAHVVQHFSPASARVPQALQIPFPRASGGYLVSAPYADTPESALHDYRHFVPNPGTLAESSHNNSIDTTPSATY